MTPDELRAGAIKLFGRRGWITRLAARLKVDRSTVHRWLQGVPISGPAVAAVECWLEQAKTKPRQRKRR